MEEATESWQREVRDRAYVEFRPTTSNAAEVCA
jgi:hypothetical protein